MSDVTYEVGEDPDEVARKFQEAWQSAPLDTQHAYSEEEAREITDLLRASLQGHNWFLGADLRVAVDEPYTIVVYGDAKYDHGQIVIPAYANSIRVVLEWITYGD